MSAKIKLTRERSTILDKEDFEYFSQWKWYCSFYGYAVRGKTINGKRTIVYLHREILQTKKNQEVDHINRNRLDNRRKNLRICVRTDNRQNTTKFKGSSKFWGVYWNKQTKSWRTRIQKNRKMYEGGLFHDEILAAKKYDELARLYYGNNAKTNF